MLSILPHSPSLGPNVALPMSRKEMDNLGWSELDILLISGDAYVDHPSFGVALIGRLLVAHGFRVGVVTQPEWENKEHAQQDIAAMGRPLLFAGVTAGAIDSMLAHYTAFRKLRHDDAYTPGGVHGARPNRATIVYTSLVRQVFPDIPVILGGIEASLRRVTHYDFWSSSLRRPLLFDSKADIISFGMGERSMLAIAHQAAAILREQPQQNANSPRGLFRQQLVQACKHIPGLAYILNQQHFTALAQELAHNKTDITTLPSYEAIVAEAPLFMQATLALEETTHIGKNYITQNVAERTLVLTPPSPGLEEQELDFLYALPFTRLPHPSYIQPIPAWEMIRTSITTHRGCGGGCSFCSLALHQGRRITSRSKKSILTEAKHIATGNGTSPAPRWAGSISDVGGPSANMWQATCTNPKECKRASCMHPAICPFFSVNQQDGVALLRSVALVEGVRHVRVASGVRFDLALTQEEALFAYTSEFTGGQLKVAPEHCSSDILRLMRKPSLTVFEKFLERFAVYANKAEKELYTIPYLMSAFPGCTKQHMQEMASWLKQRGWQPQQVQCFIPTPGTVATAMFYTGLHPDGTPLYVAKTDKERLQQHHMLFEGNNADAAAKRKEGGFKKDSRQRSHNTPPYGDGKRNNSGRPLGTNQHNADVNRSDKHQPATPFTHKDKRNQPAGSPKGGHSSPRQQHKKR